LAPQPELPAPRSEPKLALKQETFVKALLETGNQYEAYCRAYECKNNHAGAMPRALQMMTLANATGACRPTCTPSCSPRVRWRPMMAVSCPWRISSEHVLAANGIA